MTDTNNIKLPTEPTAKWEREQLEAFFAAVTIDDVNQEILRDRFKAPLARRDKATSERCQDFRFGFS